MLLEDAGRAIPTVLPFHLSCLNYV
jgi:hypothetical protein